MLLMRWLFHNAQVTCPPEKGSIFWMGGFCRFGRALLSSAQIHFFRWKQPKQSNMCRHQTCCCLPSQHITQHANDFVSQGSTTSYIIHLVEKIGYTIPTTKTLSVTHTCSPGAFRLQSLHSALCRWRLRRPQGPASPKLLASERQKRNNFYIWQAENKI